MTKAEEPCYPCHEIGANQGLSKREYFASQVLNHTTWNLLTSNDVPWERRSTLIQSGCKVAVEIADALIVALNKP